ncbi:MAG: Crp/Fnr family transcriptional regulator [Lachnospiraceae bacterium]
MNGDMDEILINCPLFTQIEPSDYHTLLTCIQARKKSFRADEFLFLNGEVVTNVGIVLSGTVELLKENAAGASHILDFLTPSQMFAEGIVSTGDKVSSVSVRAKTDCIVLMIPYERLLMTCGTSCGFHHRIIQNMVLLLGEKNRILNQKIDLLTIKGMREKLATYLLIEYHKNQNSTFEIVPNRNELAAFLNVSRTSMCRELARMKDLNMIDYYQNTFRILSKEALSNCIPD